MSERQKKRSPPAQPGCPIRADLEGRLLPFSAIVSLLESQPYDAFNYASCLHETGTGRVRRVQRLVARTMATAPGQADPHPSTSYVNPKASKRIMTCFTFAQGKGVVVLSNVFSPSLYSLCPLSLSLSLSRKVPPCEPGPAQGFFLLNGSFPLPLCLPGGSGSGVVTL